jgi:hypothetical protein
VTISLPLELPAIVRPNGKTYRPRKIVVIPCENADEFGAVVFGTHDVELATPLATEEIASRFDTRYAATDPVVGWWRDGYERGERVWVWDEQIGRAGVWFASAEVGESSPLGVSGPGGPDGARTTGSTRKRAGTSRPSRGTSTAKQSRTPPDVTA